MKGPALPVEKSWNKKKKNLEFFFRFFSPNTPECPQKISAYLVQPFGQL